VDVEAFDAAVRTAIASGRLANLQPAALDRLTESSLLTLIPGRATVPYDPESQFLALVVEGLLRTFVLAADGRQITLRYSRPGALVGAASLYAKNIAFVQMQALVDSRLLIMRPARVRAIAASDPSVARLGCTNGSGPKTAESLT
jgi:hypothetical protein